MNTALSGIQPSGRVTMGNYIGAIKQFIEMQEEFEMYIFVANLHSITVNQEKKELQDNTRDLVALYLACGLDINKTTIFLQSDVMPQAQLGWILQCHTYMGELSRMTQFKDKSAKNANNINVGLFAYPALMAADILIYDPEFVPVGEDQKQHLEITRDLALRFNNKYGETFIVPKPHIQKNGARIMSLSDPTKKMSKSDENEKGCIYLLDDEKTITKKIKVATTDNIGKVNYDVENQPGISNLLTIYSQFENITIEQAVELFKDANYATFKEAVAQSVCTHIRIIQERYQEVIENNLVEEALLIGKEKANKKAYKKLMKVQDRLGLNLKKSNN